MLLSAFSVLKSHRLAFCLKRSHRWIRLLKALPYVVLESVIGSIKTSCPVVVEAALAVVEEALNARVTIPNLPKEELNCWALPVHILFRLEVDRPTSAAQLHHWVRRGGGCLLARVHAACAWGLVSSGSNLPACREQQEGEITLTKRVASCNMSRPYCTIEWERCLLASVHGP